MSKPINPEPADLFDLLRKHDSPVVIPEQIDDEAVSERLDDSTENEAAPAAGLPPEARRALVALLRHGVIMADSKRILFDVLCRYQGKIQVHLADMYLHLLLDEKAGMALLQQQDESDIEGEEVSSLISRRTLTLYDTLLLLVLRKFYQEKQAAGAQRVIIDIERIEASLRPFLALINSSRGERRHTAGALKHMKERRILTAVRGEEDRFEITPVIRYVVDAAFLERLLDEYQTLAAKADIKLESSHDD